jgi:Spy/CpxP family protein refolding chaperone
MNKSLLVATFLTATLGLGQAFAAPRDQSPSRNDQVKWEHGQNRENQRGLGHFGRMARHLELSVGQKEQIHAILEEHRGKVKDLRQHLGESRKQLRQLVKAESFDESVVRGIGAGQADARTELMVEQARVHHRIRALMTPEQQALADQKLTDSQKGRSYR